MFTSPRTSRNRLVNEDTLGDHNTLIIVEDDDDPQTEDVQPILKSTISQKSDKQHIDFIQATEPVEKAIVKETVNENAVSFRESQKSSERRSLSLHNTYKNHAEMYMTKNIFS